MAVEIVALVVAFLTMFISASPAAQALLQKSIRSLVCLLTPNQGHCRRLLWADIPDGLLHQCHPLCQHVQGHQDHGPTSCWGNSLGQVFTKAWETVDSSQTVVKHLAKKPYQLLLSGQYFQSDVHTLEAFLMLTTNNLDTSEPPDLARLLEMKSIGGIYTAHLKPNKLVPINTTLTKNEIDRFIQGYPPFYRTTVTTTGGLELNHPIIRASHLGCGAWVLAVGMTISNGPICLLHNMRQITHNKPDAYWRGTAAMAAFQMFGRTLQKVKEYEETHGPHSRPGPGRDLWSTAAISCYDRMMTSEYSAYPWTWKKPLTERSPLFASVVGECPCIQGCIGNAAHSTTCRRDQHERKDPASYLNKKQCEAAFEVFDHDQHLDSNMEIIWPVLPEILQTAILGLSEVEHYFSHIGQKLEIPKALAEQKYIYLRQCGNDNEE